ncbi:class II glutamine amidotransferase [Pseudoduganella danionis]|uniref:Class II glutamine amidotransferase n=1 Tax=Pseudoduganella danionis TaxID=1890295 RepID=A0ABW9SNY8_9BURK|nr:class II glutamine amidotransferase [Pseudoduganella danionis]MTW33902.1 class II glutamine amidotransferase [Pseudoduganella danionis]
MCQLLAMSSKQPAALDFSFTGFARRSAEHGDGWGIALHNGSDCQLYTDALACSSSLLAQQFRSQPIKARNVIAHIRKATQGRVSLENSHPFTRKLWGQTWSFAHNGDLKLFQPRRGLYAPWGDTDSELAFCHILSELALRYEHRPPRHQLFATLQILAASIAEYGSFNFLLSNGELLFAYCSTELHSVQRQYPFSVAQLVDCDLSIDFSQHNQPDDRMTVIATRPLTSNEPWQRFAPGQLKLFIQGEEVGAQPVHQQEWDWQICA